MCASKRVKNGYKAFRSMFMGSSVVAMFEALFPGVGFYCD